MKKISQYFFPLILVLLSLLFFYQFLLRGFLPIPGDTIIGLYNPFRDLYAKDYPRGLPYKNFLITDPVRQEYPWKNLAITLEKKFELPLWNPYSFSGTPLLANFQSGVFYPLNLLLHVPPFPISWSFFIMLQPVLAGLFLYLYLRNLKLGKTAALFGSIAWAFCGFSVAWMEWGTIVHTALWAPLVLLSIDKLESRNKHHDLRKKTILWSILYVCAMLSSFFAGHLQTFFYLYVFSILYFTVRFIQSGRKIRTLVLYVILNSVFIIFSLPQLIPTLQFILLSNRAVDQSFIAAGWFIPYQNFAQFIVPDFFGNPATLNYFGIWNYGEFIGYVGIGALIMAVYAVVARHDKKTYFFLTLIVAAALLATQNLISQLPFQLNIPFISTSQPTRLIFVIDVSLAILAALGLDFFIRVKRSIWLAIIIVGAFIAILWVVVFTQASLFQSLGDLEVAKNNLKLPTVLFILSSTILLGAWRIKDKQIAKILLWLFVFVLVLDLFRFGWKFTPFTNQAYLYPPTKITTYLQSQPGVFRIATTDSQILPPNFSVMYKLQSIEGYDPLYLKNYAMFIAASEREDHSINPPYGFNRTITPRNINSQTIDFLNVKYVLSLTDINNQKFKKVLQEGQTRVYENLNVLPRAFFVEKVIDAENKQDAAKLIFQNDLAKTGIVEYPGRVQEATFSPGNAKVVTYTPNKVVIETKNNGGGFLVVSDAYYPSVHISIDGEDYYQQFPVNLAFRGVRVPAGKHTVVFEAKLF